MKKVEIRIIRDDKKEFIIDNTLWAIPSDGLEGFDSIENEVSEENYYSGAGTRVTANRIKSKERTITARLMNPSINEIQRAVVVSFFNPEHKFSVYVTYQGRTRWCEGYQIGFSCPTGNVYKSIEITWTLLSNMPYMLSTDNFGQNIGELIPMFCFPFRSIVNYGGGVGVFKFAKEVLIENGGDTKTFFKCMIYATGEVENPKLIKGDKYVRILDTMQENDAYVLDFESTPPTVKKNGVNAIGKLDRTSSLINMAIDVGGDIFGFDADSGSNNMRVEIYRYERYNGI